MPPTVTEAWAAYFHCELVVCFTEQHDHITYFLYDFEKATFARFIGLTQTFGNTLKNVS